MHENDFEKQIKDMMEGYKLSPSPSVWEKVKQRISKRKRRVWPFALLFACVITGGYFIYNNAASTKTGVTTFQNTPGKTGKNLSAIKPKESVNEKDKQVTVKNSDNNNKLTDTKAGKKNVVAQAPSKQNDENKFSLKAQSNNLLNNNNYDKNKKEVTKNDNLQKTNETFIAEKDVSVKDRNVNDNVLQQPKETTNDQVLTGTNINANNNQLQTLSANSKDSVAIATNNVNLNTNQNLLAIVDTTTKQKTNTSKAVTKRKIKTENKSSFKWQYGVTALYGASNLNKNLFQLHLNGTDKSLPASTATGGFVSRDTSPTPSHPFKYNDAFKAGVTLQRRINKNIAINTGINYTQLSNKADVTRRIENIGNSTAVSADVTYSPQSYLTSNISSSSSSTQTVTSIYRFIEIPVQWQQNFINKNKLSFSYNAGFSVMQLLSSKALIYDQNKNIYFSDKSALQPTQLQAGLGLNMHIDLKKKYTLTIGPQLNYSLSKALKNSDYGTYHYFMYGLQAGISMHK